MNSESAGDGVTRRSYLPVLGWAAASAFFFYAWVLRVSPSVIIEELMLEFNVGAALLGNLSAAYFYGYAGMQLPVGMLYDRFGVRRLITIALLLVSLGCVMFATSHSLMMVTLSRFIIGAACAFSLVGAFAMATKWFAPTKFALLSGCAMAAGMAGGMVGQAPLRLAVQTFDWRVTVNMLAMAGFLIALLCWLTIRDKPAPATHAALKSINNHAIFAGLREVVRHRQTWLIALTGLGATGPLLGYAGLWGIPFLETAYDLPRVTAATLTSLVIAGWGVGAPLWGWFSDRIRRRRAPMLVGLSLQTTSLSILILYPSLTVWQIGCLSFLVGLFGGSQIACFALIRELHAIRIVSTALGLVNGCVTSAGALFQPVIGLMLDFFWSGQTLQGMQQGIRIYTATEYRQSMSVLIFGCIGAVCCVVWIKETYARARDEI